MFNKLRTFWRTFWSSIRTAYNKAFKEPLLAVTQPWRDIARINFLDVFVSKINNLTNTEATFDIASDSTQAEPLKELCAALEAQRYEITAAMLADGDYYVFPSTNDRGELYHSYMTQEQVRITDMDGDQIKEAFGIIDYYVDNADRTYFLLRHHKLDADGTLSISYQCVDANMKQARLAKWEYIIGSEVTIAGANHIGFGRYKSPTSSRGLSSVYGVGLTYGCAEIEQRIRDDLKMIEDEYNNGRSVIFTDPRNLVKKEDAKQYEIADNVIPLMRRAGDTGSNIDIFSPALRWSQYYEKLQNDLALFEKQVGTSRGILTDNETSYTATATAVRRANSDTLALIDKVRAAIDEGNRMTLAADAIFLNISSDLWEYVSDWYDPFEDPAEQWSRLITASENGAAEKADLMRWLFPRLSDAEIEEKLTRIGEATAAGTEDAIDRILAGR